jgi:hypothetical protein
MKALIAIVLLGAIGVGAYYQMPKSKSQPNPIHQGASVAEVEKVLGPPQRVLKQFGQEMRVYKGQSGKKYVLTFANDELVEIQQ